MRSVPSQMFRSLVDRVNDAVVRWRSGTREGQLIVLAVLVLLVVGQLTISWMSYDRMPISGFYVPMLLGMLLLRFWPLFSLIGMIALACVITVTHQGGLTTARSTSVGLMTISTLIILFQASRSRSGLPSMVNESVLVDLRDKLQSTGRLPQMPAGWRCEAAIRTAGGINFAGDFLVADLTSDGRRFEVVLVDVCGKGVAAGTRSLQFAGALGGLIGALPAQGVFAAANGFMLRQRWDDGFATAIHLSVDLESGAWSILSAGHPPALLWDDRDVAWQVTEAHGMALGIVEQPEFTEASGVLQPGDALMLYTDGLVESRRRSLDDGIVRLSSVAHGAVGEGFEGAPVRILTGLGGSDDDRAVVLVSRNR